jgi:hypothetical protein
MRSCITLTIAAIVVLLGFGVTNNAYAAYAYDNEDFHCNVPTANDLHITYYSDTKMRLVDHYDDGFPAFVATPTGPDSSQWECTWSGQILHDSDWVHVGVKFWQEAKNYLKKKNIYWTLNGTKVGDDLPGPGFRVEPPSGSGTPTYTIINSNSFQITVDSLRFKFSTIETPLDSMLYPRPGFGPPPVVSFSLAPGAETTFVFTGEKRADYWYLMAQGIANAPSGTSYFVQQHQHPRSTPALTNYGLLILLALLILSGIYVIYQRRKGVARA